MIDAQLESAYSPSSMVGGSAEPFLAEYRVRSEVVHRQLAGRIATLAGGSLVLRPQAAKPTLVFVHGGYWQALSAADSMFLAADCATAGWGYSALEYTIAPHGEIEAMIDEVRQGLVATATAAGGPLVVAGHSAGAHLVAMVCLVAESPVPVQRVLLLSGVFDLVDLPRTSINDALGLTAQSAARLSPLRLGVAQAHPVEVWWGSRDTPRFAEMSRDYAAHLARHGCQVTRREVPCHHFDIVDRLAELPTALR